VDIFVSRYVVYRSLTLALVGGYLIVLGGLAELSQWLNVGLDLATVILLGGLGAAGLALLLLSEQVRRRAQRFLHTHFFRHKYDYRLEWMAAARHLSHATTIPDIAAQTVQRILDAMWVGQVAMYAVTDMAGRFTLAHQSGYDRLPVSLNLSPDLVEQLRAMMSLFVSREGQQVPPGIPLGFAAAFEEISVGMIVPVAALDNLSGILVVGPEVSGKPFGVDDWDLLAALAAQAGALILNAHLSREASEGRELQVLARLSAFVAHDLKNSVGMLSLLAENAAHHMHKPEFQADAIHTLTEVTARMQKLLVALRTPIHRPVESVIRASVTGTVEACLHDLQPQIPSRITLDARLGPTPDVVMDPAQLRTVLVNLVVNAIEAIPGDGRITLETRVEQNWVAFTVADTGPGMTPDFIRERLFRPFQTTKPRGLGIGLYQCQQVVRALGGELTADSHEGVGTRMTVRLPAASGSQIEEQLAEEQLAGGSRQLAE
jgi:hypothetical protein